MPIDDGTGGPLAEYSRNGGQQIIYYMKMTMFKNNFYEIPFEFDPVR